MDFNSHMKNTAFLDKAADVRLLFFAEKGFPTADIARLRVGPDGSRWLFQSDVLRDGKLCARARSSDAWLDLDARRLVAPPKSLLVALQSLDKTADFEVLRGQIRASRTPAA